MPQLHVNDIDLFYEITGQGQPVLFIHGLGSSHNDWERQTPFFSRQYQVITFDLRGHGQSQKPPGPYTMSLFARDTAGLVNSLGAAPVHVIGVSLGGMIAFQLAVDHPELVQSLVIVNTGPELIPRTLNERWQVFMRFAVVRLFGMRKIGEVLGKRLFPKVDQAAVRQLFVERWEKNDPKAYIASMQAIVGWSVVDHLSVIDMPTLIMAGENDYTPVSIKEDCVSKMPQAELAVIRNSGHATPVDSTEKFNEVVASFLQKQG